MKNRTFSHRLLLPLLGVVAMLGLVLSSVYYFGVAQASGSSLVPLPNSVPLTGTSAKALGQHNPNALLTIGMVLQLRDAAGQQSMLQSLYHTNSPSYHQWLNPQQFNAHFAPATADITAAKGLLTGAGLRLQASSSPTLLLAQGTTSQVEATFHTTILNYTLSDGSQVYANNSSVLVPTALSEKILAVFGLSNITVSAPHKQPAQSHGTRYGGGPHGTGLIPSQITGIYNIDPVYKQFNDQGQGETIALFEQSAYIKNDIYQYTKMFGLPYPDLENIPVLGGTTDQSGAIETELDIELALAAAPKVKHVLVYESGFSDLETVAQYQQIASDNRADTISTSWGGCAEYFLKSQVTQAENQIFFHMATQGQSMFSATGDFGAYGACDRLNLPHSQALQIADPNDTPYITAVGGTSFETPGGTILFDPGNNPHPHYPGVSKEKVWITYPCNTKACDGGGSSGGVSRIWAEGDYAFDKNGKPLPGVDEPGYSKSGAYCGQQPGVLCRENPDVSLDADPGTGYAVYCTDTGAGCIKSGWLDVGGTSCASPVWAAIAALYDVHHHGRQGLFNYIVFQYDSAAGYASQFHDITGYNNGYYSASKYYDMATGIGTPDVFNLVKS
ncbi:MAG: S53 family peptidase [Ktedonobacteraceae bacterium]